MTPYCLSGTMVIMILMYLDIVWRLILCDLKHVVLQITTKNVCPVGIIESVPIFNINIS